VYATTSSILIDKGVSNFFAWAGLQQSSASQVAGITHMSHTWFFSLWVREAIGITTRALSIWKFFCTFVYIFKPVLDGKTVLMSNFISKSALSQKGL
jgi:hypothetical protein